ncbi:hypothetical protein SAMN05421644_1182 [Allochromatium warmingii]|uniref:Uncharacterized protein n=1 Tax=Allochromatium warmingii TaxID=61595 RepID=A0A1H3FEN4_ALLWA|nr:hypothetical protein [Allochromatium warmingii]SDX88858.1 hypothetical protein SAMN05421644_1182 [Allochromatium warmingii]
MSHFMRIRFAVWLLGGGLALLAAHATAEGYTIPEALAPWVPWVLEQEPPGRDPRVCPLAADGAQRLCAWPGRLQLELDASGGRFTQRWTLNAADWVMLPGDVEHWPQAVQADNHPLPVMLRDGRPAVQLAAGQYQLSGRFQWRDRPESLALPPQTGLVTLALDGGAPLVPRLDREARLWLRDPGSARTATEGDQLRLDVYRRLDDEVPLRVLTRLELEVSGRTRALELGPVLLPGGQPSQIVSPLPTRLDLDGTLRVQVRPGRWVVEITSHHVGAISELRRPEELAAPWPEREVWAFAAQPERRRVELTGLERLDPNQTGIPSDWARLPVYAAGPGAVLLLNEQGRGETDPEPNRLRLARELWLDFDGQGYSVRDRLNGEVTRSWRLETAPELALGQARIAEQPALITRLTADAPPGIEVRRGQLNLVADSRLESAPADWIPASGWSLTLDGATSRLHLPPGWALLAVSGVDNRPDTWLTRWTLLDLFLVLILTLGVGRLWGVGWGALALVTLTLIWLEPGAPRLVWLHLLAAAALLRLLPQQTDARGLARWRGLVRWYQRLAILALLTISLPFLVTEVRHGLYPQLAQPYWSATGARVGAAPPRSAPHFSFNAQLMEAPAPAEMDEMGAMQPERKARASSLSEPVPAAPISPLERFDPKALIQTGPGIPDWQWRQVEFSWSAPVGPQDGARLWWLTPRWRLVCVLIGGALLLALGWRVADVSLSRWTLQLPSKLPTSLAVLMLAVALTALFTPRSTLAAEFPNPELLDDLRTRLLAPPECLPDCLTLADLAVQATAEQLTLDLTLDAATALAAPLLETRSGWSPSAVRVDGVALETLRRDPDGRLLLALPRGRHQVQLTGTLGTETRVDVRLALPPRQLTTDAEGWRIEGVNADGRLGQQLQLLRLAATESSGEQPLTQEALPPLLLVERRLDFGRDWRVTTQVSRLSAPEFPVLIAVPLLPGESVQTAGLQSDGQRLQVVLAPGQTALHWVSSLTPVDELELTASSDPRLTESWWLDLSPLWHLDAMDLAPVHHQGQGSRWLPQWRPLPGERLRLRISRPEGVPGPTLTLDRVAVQIAPGRRGTDTTLTLTARSTQGGVHTISLPDGAELRSLSIDGRTLPLPSSQSIQIELPLLPGTQDMRLAWRSPTPLLTSFRPLSPDLGQSAVNLTQQVRLPDDRWVLWASGAGIGPAVLFWGLLIVLIAVALLLGRVQLTPLRWYDWLLLGIGLALSEVVVAVLIGGWLFALGWRQRLDTTPLRWWQFNLLQIGLVLLTLLALSALIGAVQQGLLGHPEMWIRGHGSSATILNWYQDRGGPQLPEIWVISVPLWVYRALMLAWALWLAVRLLDWLRWGWQGFAQPMLWVDRGAVAASSGQPPASSNKAGGW